MNEFLCPKCGEPEERYLAYKCKSCYRTYQREYQRKKRGTKKIIQFSISQPWRQHAPQ